MSFLTVETNTQKIQTPRGSKREKHIHIQTKEKE